MDPCEGLIDVPLVYEQGWKKKLSYMFAFTVPPPIDDSLLRYEAVDVTDIVWKYSTDFKGVGGHLKFSVLICFCIVFIVALYFRSVEEGKE